MNTISGEQQGGRVDSSSAQSSARKGCSRGGEEGQVAFTPFDLIRYNFFQKMIIIGEAGGFSPHKKRGHLI